MKATLSILVAALFATLYASACTAPVPPQTRQPGVTVVSNDSNMMEAAAHFLGITSTDSGSVTRIDSLGIRAIYRDGNSWIVPTDSVPYVIAVIRASTSVAWDVRYYVDGGAGIRLTTFTPKYWPGWKWPPWYTNVSGRTFWLDWADTMREGNYVTTQGDTIAWRDWKRWAPVWSNPVDSSMVRRQP